MLALIVSTTAFAQSDNTTVSKYLQSQPNPVFRAGHTLPPLTRYGWSLGYDVRVAMAKNWGYALEYGGYATESDVQKDLADPNSMASKLCALTASDPKRYKLAVICSRELPTKNLPPEAWARDKDGKYLNGKAQSLDGTSWGEDTLVWSPEAPDSIWLEAGRLRADPLRKIRAKCPIAIVLNGGEYGLGVPGFAKTAWEADPRIMKAKGDRSWFEYTSIRKAHSEILIANAVRAAVPDRQLYIYYSLSGNIYSGMKDFDWGSAYENLKTASDLPSDELYYRHFNDGFVGNKDMLSLVLSAKGVEISNGNPLTYAWLCGGWPRENLNGDKGLSDITSYTGFLKCFYTAGMVGGNAGYYDYPKGGFDAEFPADQPPHWLRQMMALSQVHALFSHLEPFLRKGDLLPGPDKGHLFKEFPAYEFPTGDPTARVIARKMRSKSQWLITAWAADGKDRNVTVSIPQLGHITLNARGCGTVYQAKIVGGKPVIVIKDVDGLHPTKGYKMSSG